MRNRSLHYERLRDNDKTFACRIHKPSYRHASGKASAMRASRLPLSSRSKDVYFFPTEYVKARTRSQWVGRDDIFPGAGVTLIRTYVPLQSRLEPCSLGVTSACRTTKNQTLRRYTPPATGRENSKVDRTSGVLTRTSCGGFGRSPRVV